MKKVLLIAGFAFCASMAFAQAPKLNNLCNEGMMAKMANVPQMQEQRVDYKASIFTKDTPTPVATYDFSNASELTFGTVTSQTHAAADSLCGATHQNTKAGSNWQRLANLAALSTLDTNNYRFLVRNDSLLQAQFAYASSNNGFVVVDPVDASRTPEDETAQINSYVSLPALSVSSATMVELGFNQWIYRGNPGSDCFVDYLGADNTWHPVEVNVGNVDIDAWNIGNTMYSITLPTAAVVSGEVTIRFRYCSDGDGINGTYSHGGGWMVDDVQLFPVPAARWDFVNKAYLDGFYGMVPQGFKLPLGFIIAARNSGANDLTNVKLNVKHRYVDDGETDFTNVFSVDQPSIPAGNASNKVFLRINERGFVNDSVGFGTWDDNLTQTEAIGFETYGWSADTLDYEGWGLRGLPTDEPGKHQFVITATATAGGQNIEMGFDTMVYTVTEMIGGTHLDSIVGMTVPGYRWAHDNGVIAGGAEFSYQSANSGGFTASGTHHFSSGYEATVAFHSPSEVPEGWVLRGMEIIPSTKLTAEDIDGARIAPTMRMWYVGGSGAGLYSFYTDAMLGVSTFQVSGASAALDTIGYKGVNNNGALENRYHAVNILFPEQPEIYPSWGYMFGYENEQGFFAAARQRVAYKYDRTSDSIVYYDQVPALSDYYTQLSPKGMIYEVLAVDPVRSAMLPAYLMDYYPLIRMIVGPKMDLAKAGVTIECGEFGSGNQMSTYTPYRRGAGVLCDVTDSIVKGGSYSYYIYPGYADEDNDSAIYGNSVIDYLVIDGDTIWDRFDDPRYAAQDSIAILNNTMVSRFEYDVYNVKHDGVDANGNPNTEEVWPVMLKRYGYEIFFLDVQEDHTISAHTVWRELGIDELASDVDVSVAPNPATSQVRVNLNGVSGKVSCDLIDMSGRVVYNNSFNAENEHIINLNGVPAGAYFVRLTGDSFSKVEKLIVR